MTWWHSGGGIEEEARTRQKQHWGDPYLTQPDLCQMSGWHDLNWTKTNQSFLTRAAGRLEWICGQYSAILGRGLEGVRSRPRWTETLPYWPKRLRTVMLMVTRRKQELLSCDFSTVGSWCFTELGALFSLLFIIILSLSLLSLFTYLFNYLSSYLFW